MLRLRYPRVLRSPECGFVRHLCGNFRLVSRDADCDWRGDVPCALRQAGYNQNFSMGILAAGGTLGIIIPPSIPMIIYAIMVGVSVIDLFLAGIGPGSLAADCSRDLFSH
jgi:hypothetical protein